MVGSNWGDVLGGIEMMTWVQGITYVYLSFFSIIANKGLKECDQSLSSGIKGREFIYDSKILICEKQQMLILKLSWFIKSPDYRKMNLVSDMPFL